MHRLREDLGKARWLPEEKTALVQRSRGKYMSTMGFASDGQRLFPEEAVFLVDRDEIELTVVSDNGQERTLNRVEVYSLLETCNIDMKSYTLYAALREQRFQIYRHGSWRTDIKAWKDLAAPRVMFVRQEPQTSSPTSKKQRLVQDDLSVSFDVYRPQSGFSKNRMGKPDFSIVILSADGKMPSVASLRNAVRACDPSIPLRLGIVGDSSVTFVEVSDFDPVAAIQEQEDDDIGVKLNGASSTTASASKDGAV